MESSGATVSSVRINHLCNLLRGTVRYLEIGVEAGSTFTQIRADSLVGVDPSPLLDIDTLPERFDFWRGTSDSFFESYRGPAFDIIFLDGLHEASQTYRDLVAGVRVLNSGGFILIDDIWPTDFASAVPDRSDSKKMKTRQGISHNRWYGDVYKVLAAVQVAHPEVSVQVIGNGITAHAQALVWLEPGVRLESTKRAKRLMKHVKYANYFGASADGEISSPWREWVTDETFLGWMLDHFRAK
ncbi:class I SAM-dependent methyltransferase [Pontimonas sp.]|nr:class I SAM-dependent methyltransferase [Pontimonas sp.]